MSICGWCAVRIDCLYCRLAQTGVVDGDGSKPRGAMQCTEQRQQMRRQFQLSKEYIERVESGMRNIAWY